MKSYTMIEKDRIAIYTDILENPLTMEEMFLVMRDETTPEVEVKISNLRSQGVRLGIELEKLSQRGVEIIFDLEKIITPVIDQLAFVPELLFVCGNQECLVDKTATVVTSYQQFVRASGNIIYIADQCFEEMLGDRKILQSLMRKTLIIVSNRYRKKAVLGHKSKRSEHAKKKVFVFGSRTGVEITDTVLKSLKRIKEQQIEILMGDHKNGIEKKVVDYFHTSPCSSCVQIFTTMSKPRIPVETTWSVQTVITDSGLKNKEKLIILDQTMADQSDWGMALFNPINVNSIGSIRVNDETLRNIILMLLNNKKVKLFYKISDIFEVKNLDTITDLEEVIELYKTETLSEQESELIMHSKGTVDPVKKKYEKIQNKFTEILKEEKSRIKVSF